MKKISRINAQFYPGIEMLRGVAVSMVVIHHAFGLGDINISNFNWLPESFGSTGVILFFTLSAFLLTDSLLLKKTSSKEFYLRRFFRIAPAYYFMLIFVYVFFAAPSNIWSKQGLVQTSANVFFLQQLSPATVSNLNVNGALWTLTIEMILYAVLPVLIYLVKKSVSLTIASMILIGICYRLAVQFGQLDALYFSEKPLAINQSIFIQQQFLGWLPIFAFGILFAYLKKGKSVPNIKGTVSFWKISALLLPTILVSRMIYSGSDIKSVWFSTYHIFIGFTCAVAIFIVSKFQIIKEGLITDIALYLGKRSYSIYLWHFPILLSILGKGPQNASPTHFSPYMWIVSILVILLVAEISYRLIELPGTAYGKKVIAKLCHQ
jgi:peptidoglycan/LPS O-acetylase OafA/YrhL